MAMTRSQSKATALMVSRDLFFGSKVTGTAAKWGLSVELEGDVSQVMAKLSGHPYRCLILDLGTPGLSVSEMMAALLGLWQVFGYYMILVGFAHRVSHSELTNSSN